MAAALGYQFYDHDNRLIEPLLETRVMCGNTVSKWLSRPMRRREHCSTWPSIRFAPSLNASAGIKAFIVEECLRERGRFVDGLNSDVDGPVIDL
jgi:hypothetical protein